MNLCFPQMIDFDEIFDTDQICHKIDLSPLSLRIPEKVRGEEALNTISYRGPGSEGRDERDEFPPFFELFPTTSTIISWPSFKFPEMISV